MVSWCAEDGVRQVWHRQRLQFLLLLLSCAAAVTAEAAVREAACRPAVSDVMAAVATVVEY